MMADHRISYLRTDGEGDTTEIALSHEDGTYLAVLWTYRQVEIAPDVYVMLSEPAPVPSVLDETEGRFHYVTWRKFTESYRASFVSGQLAHPS